MVEAATQAPHVVVDLVGDLDVRLGEIAASTISRLEGNAPIVVSLRHIATVHSDGFIVLVDAINAIKKMGRQIFVISNGRQTKTLLNAASLSDSTISHASAARRPTARMLLLARHAS